MVQPGLLEVCKKPRRRLCRQLAEAADLQPSDQLLDVGCGCAEQDILWVKEFDVSSIVGLEITPLRVKLANSGIDNAGLSDRIEVRHGSTTECPFDNGAMRLALSLEAAESLLS